MLLGWGKFIGCDGEGCKQKIPNHKWGKVKTVGWFFSRDGEKAYCPEHLPPWVSDWRA